jgi:predicted dehydrogenase
MTQNARLCNNSPVIEPMRALKVALVGCGAISESFYGPAISAIAPNDRLSVTCLVDPDPRRLSIVGATFPSALQLLGLEGYNSEDIDLAVVASPQRFHAEQTIKLLTQGVHVLCEKPLASNLYEAEEMVKVATQNKRLLAAGLFRRFFPTTQFIRDLISGEDLGKPIRFSWSEGGVFDWPAATPSFFLKGSSTGGVFADLGAHVLDLLLHWFGPVADFVYQDDSMGGLEANASLHLRFEAGVTGQLRLSRDTPIPNSVWIEFERGFLWFQGGTAAEVTLHFKHSNLVAKSNLYSKSNQQIPFHLAPGEPARTYAQSFMEQIRNLCRAIRGEDTLLVPASEALASISLTEKCYASRKLMNMPWLSASEQVAAEALVG